PHELARLVELSEARAYFSLLSGRDTDISEKYAFSAAKVGEAVLLKAASVKTSLVVNRVIGLGIAKSATEETVDEIASAYAKDGISFGIELSPFSQPDSLPEWLRKRRLRKAVSSQVLYRNGSPPPPLYDSWTRSTGLRVAKAGPQDASLLAKISCENFRMPAPVEALLAATGGAPGWRHWLAFDGGEAIGGSLSFVQDGICWLGWTSVLPSHRGRWVHAGIVAKQLEDAHDARCSWVTTETAFSTKEKPDPAYFNLKKWGFQDAYLRPIYVSVSRQTS
ncbi:MAG: hypothetical protein ACREC3_04930, partial [Methyloceanibacter sp.]